MALENERRVLDENTKKRNKKTFETLSPRRLGSVVEHRGNAGHSLLQSLPNGHIAQDGELVDENCREFLRVSTQTDESECRSANGIAWYAKHTRLRNVRVI